MSLGNLLSIASGALQAHQRAIGTIGHNVANAQTPGYSRQQVQLTAASPQTLGHLLQIGRGVDVNGINRVRDAFYDTSWRQEAGAGARYNAMRQALEQVSGVLGEPSDVGITAALDALIDSFQTLASNPADPTARAVVVANATVLADRFRSIDTRLDGISQNIVAELRQTTSEANGMLAEVDALNSQIRKLGGNAPDLLDRRDVLLDRLSQNFDIRVVGRDAGTVDVLLGGIQLVSSGGGVQPLSIGGTGPYQLQLGNPPAAIAPKSGSLKGLLDAAETIGVRGTSVARATGLRGQLDDLALGIVSAVNGIHASYDPTINPLQPTLTPAPTPLRAIGPFFNPTGVTASSIGLDPSIQADPTQIAAGWSTAPGDNSIALRLGELRYLAVPIPGTTTANGNSPAVAAGPAAALADYYTGVVAALGVVTQDAGNRAVAQSVLVGNITAQRQSVSGVNIDEEMVALIQHQQAYAAAARLVQAADEMLRELINLGR
ncbi:MAG: flagellar hook-associated protein FlgK [Gemmatimonadales bacterium]|nr:flagellar hook-associated protein FlgK [Gemmatimonadales bacterium]